MVAYQPFHDTESKTLLNGRVLPPNQTAEKDLDDALENIFQHPNVGPFISRNLIQHLVTSNPSPGYIQRVAEKFNNNGAGVRGDMRAVVEQILLDPEARSQGPTAGHLREPVLFVANFMRTLGGRIADHPFLTDTSTEMGQKLFYSPSVFNYYSPFYRIPQTQLYGPEFQILTSQTALHRVNFIGKLVYGFFGGDVTLNLDRFTAAARDPATLAQLVNYEFFGGRLSEMAIAELTTAIASQSANSDRARTALYLAGTSAQYQVMR
jgi:hypothetical protein